MNELTKFVVFAFFTNKFKSFQSLKEKFVSFRKSWSQNGDKGVKRLFTPEIKKMLKDWLVRRRENPYPSRDEKKILAVETGENKINLNEANENIF